MSQEPTLTEPYLTDPVYKAISYRFFKFHHIFLSRHIKQMRKLNSRLEQGFEFVAHDHAVFGRLLERAGFGPDDEEWHFGVVPSVGKIAAAATHGQGYREKGSPSLHCAVAEDYCSVHLDNIGFRAEGYSVNAGGHIVDELLWQSIILDGALSKVLPGRVVDLLHRLHPTVPSTRQFNPLTKEVGVEVDLFSRRSKDLQQQTRLTIDLTHSCSDATCGVWRKINGQSVQADNKVMLSFRVTGW